MKTATLKAIALVTVAVLVIGSDAFAQKVTFNDIVYKINKKDGTAEIDKGTEAKGHVIIPEAVSYKGKNYKVTSIGKCAFSKAPRMGVFQDCEENLNLTGVSIPSSVTHIGLSAFRGCVLLKEVAIPQSVIYIGPFAFASCKMLNGIVIPNSVTTIGAGAFSECTALKSIVVPDQEPERINNKGAIVSYVIVNPFNACENVISVKGNTIDYPMYVYDCGKENSDWGEQRGWLDKDCPFMKFKYPKLEANGFEFYNETTAKPDVAQNEVSAQGKSGSASSIVMNVSQSDVDKNIPHNSTNNENTFAIIIANENYQEVSKVPNAINDGTIFAEYCKRTLGLPATNVHLVKDATFVNMKREMNWLKRVAQAYMGEAKIIVYYAGHGVPDEATQTSYLLSVDGLGNDVSTAFSLKEFYKTLSEIPSKSVMVFLDACFSGATRDGGMMAAARGVAIKAKAETPKGKLVVFSAAQGDETAYPYTENGHGMFTYYLLKKIQETGGDVTLGDLADYVKKNVGRKSIVVNGKSQTPTVSSSVTLAEEWKTWKLK